MQTNQRIPHRMKAAAAALLAAGVLAASVAPSTAARMWAPQSGMAEESRVSAFHHHFYRGTQHPHAHGAPRADMMALADESEPMDEAMSYCASRFRSYDPASGTYLGYDGNEHACP